MIMQLPSIDDAQKAIKGGKDPMAFLHLGILYAQGADTPQDEMLAHYFIKKALDMGCKEAEEYLNIEYESGKKDFATDIESYIGEDGSMSRETIHKLRARVEVERKAKHYGNLSKIRKHLASIYPEYNRKKAIDDILNERESIDADILYSTSTVDNTSEIYLDLQDRLLQQLYGQVDIDDKVWKRTKTDALSKDERELAQTLVNFTSSYGKVCKKYHVENKEIYNLDTIGFYPYIKVHTLATLRRQGFRCLLSIKDVEPTIRYLFLECLGSDEKLLNVCEAIRDQNLQLFLISFVELNIDIESLEINSLALLRAFRNNNLRPLAEHLNAFVGRLDRVGIKHNLPFYTLDNLPIIDLSKLS